MKSLMQYKGKFNDNPKVSVACMIGLLSLAYAGYQILTSAFINIAILVAGAAALTISLAFPSFTVLCLIILGIPGFLPAEVLESIPLPNFLPVDLVVITMIGAIAVKYIFFNRRRSVDLKYLFLAILIFVIYFLFEIVRNYTQYGLSAPGEVRFRYFYLIPAIYVAHMYDTGKSRILLLKMFILVSLFGGLFVFFINFIPNVTSVFQYSHFTAATLSLGIAYGFAVLYLCKHHHLLKLSTSFIFAIGVAAFLSVLLDQHRSVWLACLAFIPMLIYWKEVTPSRLTWAFFLVSVILGATLVVYGQEIVSYFGIRILALTNPEQDPNAYWRQLVWRASMERFWEAPLFGEGFGGHWNLYIPELAQRSTVQPHNFYIMTLVKTGVVGLIIYLAIMIIVWSKFSAWLKLHGNNSEYPIVLAASMILFVSHCYYMTYGLDHYTWVIIGLGMAVVRNTNVINNDSLLT